MQRRHDDVTIYLCDACWDDPANAELVRQHLSEWGTAMAMENCW